MISDMVAAALDAASEIRFLISFSPSIPPSCIAFTRFLVADTSRGVQDAVTAMSWLATFTLAVLHSLYHLILVFKSLAFRYRGSPLPLAAPRSKLPSHLALTLVEDSIKDEEAAEKYMLNTVDRCAEWCRAVGIRRLTVYDREGASAFSFQRLDCLPESSM